MTEDATQPDVLTLTSEIVSAHVANNSVHAKDLPALIQTVHAALTGLGQAPLGDQPATGDMPSKQAIRKSMASPDFLISFIDGRPYKTLRRHLATHGFDERSYREKFGLPADYPMVSRAYSEARRGMAKAIGLGRKAGARVASAAEAVADTVAEAVAPKPRGTRKPRNLTDALASAKDHLAG